MIDKIVITLSDEGKFQVNVGDTNYINAHSKNEALIAIRTGMDLLAWFPNKNNEPLASPITLDEFKRRNKKLDGSTRKDERIEQRVFEKILSS